MRVSVWMLTTLGPSCRATAENAALSCTGGARLSWPDSAWLRHAGRPTNPITNPTIRAERMASASHAPRPADGGAGAAVVAGSAGVARAPHAGSGGVAEGAGGADADGGGSSWSGGVTSSSNIGVTARRWRTLARRLGQAPALALAGSAPQAASSTVGAPTACPDYRLARRFPRYGRTRGRNMPYGQVRSSPPGEFGLGAPQNPRIGSRRSGLHR